MFHTLIRTLSYLMAKRRKKCQFGQQPEETPPCLLRLLALSGIAAKWKQTLHLPGYNNNNTHNPDIRQWNESGAMKPIAFNHSWLTYIHTGQVNRDTSDWCTSRYFLNSVVNDVKSVAGQSRPWNDKVNRNFERIGNPVIHALIWESEKRRGVS